MTEKTGPPADRERKAHPLFVALFLTADADEDSEDDGRPQRRRASRRQKRVLRTS